MTTHAPTIYLTARVPHLPSWALAVVVGIVLIALIVVVGPQPVAPALHHHAHARFVPMLHYVPAAVVTSHHVG